METIIPGDEFPIDKIAAIFDNTTNSYKYYWFLAILEDIAENNNENIKFQQLVQRMISQVWYPLSYYKLSFGKADGFKKIAAFILTHIEIDNSANSPDIFEQIKSNSEAHDFQLILNEVRALVRYVPTRFLRPFFYNETAGMKDSVVDQRIKVLAHESSENAPNKCPYYFSGSAIVLNKGWKEFFKKNIALLRAYTYWHLSRFIQNNNPNAIGVPEKLFKPVKRDLTDSISSWRFFMDLRPETRCIYTGENIPKKFSLDHFIPWSYTVHDKIWNLLPVKKEVNSKKGDCLPNLSLYLENFSLLQFDFVKTIVKVDRFRHLADQYCILYNCNLDDLLQLPLDRFQLKIKDSLIPMVQIASNMGFNNNWVYQAG